ncbi:6-phosphofructokinase [Sunxiuqinia sp. sy24]
MTSGGDAPKMNAAIRAITRVAIYHEPEVVSINHGNKGMVEADF